MKKLRFSEQQIAYILRQAEEATSVEEVCRKAGISEATYYNWRKKYGGLTSEMKRLKQLDEEKNRRLKKLVADLSLDKDAAVRDPPENMKPARQREIVDHVRQAWQVSIRRACRALPVERSSYHYRSRRTEQAPLSKRIKEIAETRVRYGYPRIHVLAASRRLANQRQASVPVVS